MKKAVLAGILVSAALLQAAPVLDRGQREFQQPDGAVFTGKPRGDEYLHWIETEDGDIVIFNQNTKQYEKAEVGADSLIGLGKAYRRPENAAQARSPQRSAKTREALKNLWMKKKRERKLLQQGIVPDPEK